MMWMTLGVACLGGTGLAPSAALASDKVVAGAVLAPQVLGTLDGVSVQLPDPQGRVVIVEAIRSADW